MAKYSTNMITRRNLLKFAGLGAIVPFIPKTKKQNQQFIGDSDTRILNAFNKHPVFSFGIFKPFYYNPTDSKHSEHFFTYDYLCQSAYVYPGGGRLADRYVETDRVAVPMYDIVASAPDIITV